MALQQINNMVLLHIGIMGLPHIGIMALLHIAIMGLLHIGIMALLHCFVENRPPTVLSIDYNNNSKWDLNPDPLVHSCKVTGYKDTSDPSVPRGFAGLS